MPDSVKKYIYFKLDNSYFAIKSSWVQDVITQQNMTPVPLAPPSIIGMFNLRGKIITCIDLNRTIGLSAFDKSKKHMLLVFKTANHLYSFPVDQIYNTFDVCNSHIKEAPGNVDTAWVKISEGVIHKDEHLIVLLDGNKLQNTIEK